MPFNLNGIYLGRRCTRDELANLWGYESRNAIERGIVTPAGSNAIILFITRKQEGSAVQYEDYISGDRLCMEGETRHSNDQALVQARKAAKRIYLFYREKHHNPFVYLGEVELLRSEINDERPSKFIFQIAQPNINYADIEHAEGELNREQPTDRAALITARLGQGLFRERVCELWGGRDSIFNIQNLALLTASHIKPWRVSSNEERLSGYNGLLLTPNIDKLFNDGFISFEDDGSIIISDTLEPNEKEYLGVADHLRLRFVLNQQIPYLRYHRGEEDGNGLFIR